MSSLKTVKIKDDKQSTGYRIINKNDFDPVQHQTFGATPAKSTPVSLTQLKEEASSKGIKNAQSLNKTQLIEALKASTE